MVFPLLLSFQSHGFPIPFFQLNHRRIQHQFVLCIIFCIFVFLFFYSFLYELNIYLLFFLAFFFFFFAGKFMQYHLLALFLLLWPIYWTSQDCMIYTLFCISRELLPVWHSISTFLLEWLLSSFMNLEERETITSTTFPTDESLHILCSIL